MTKQAKNQEAEAQLTQLRSAIDRIDDQLIALLHERIEVVHQVAGLKAKHWPKDCYIRPGREGAMHRRIAHAFEGSRFAPKAAVAIWRLLIGSSTTVESPLNIAYLASHPEHYWLAREYFGPLVGLTSVAAPGLVERSNMLLLPTPELSGDSWWRTPPSHKGEALQVFAKLPVANEELSHDATPAVALAAIAPEPSGNDISYLVLTLEKGAKAPHARDARVFQRGQQHLVVVDGFVTPDSEAYKAFLTDAVTDHYWLGAHPRPLTFGATHG